MEDGAIAKKSSNSYNVNILEKILKHQPFLGDSTYYFSTLHNAVHMP